jgi:NDP-sugar pyrophosphorylase family protein
VVEHDGPVLKTIVEKPSSASEATPLCNMGVYRLRREFLDYLRDVPADPLALIAAIERAASDGRALVHQSAAPFLPLKYPGHLWGHVRALHEGQLPAERVIASGDVYVGPNCRLENAILGPGVRVGAETGTVPVDDWDDLSAVVIGPGASIGARTILSGGVRIGADAIVHDGAIVEADVPDGAVVG